MRKSRSAVVWVVSMGLVAGLAGALQAEPVAVTDYDWLQLRPAAVTVSVGGAAGGGSGYGSPTDMRYANHVWIPNGTLTSNGATDYWATVTLDQPRQVKTVRVQWWASEGTAISNYYVRASTNNSDWTVLASKNYGLLKTGTRFWDTLPVSQTSEWRYIQVLVKATEYSYGSANRGGPGIYEIAPAGDGFVEDTDVNWAHKATFGTTTANNNFTRNNTGWNDGWFTDYDGSPYLAGNDANPWPATSYGQLDLIKTRLVNKARILWFSGYGATSFNVKYSNDGSTFTAVTQTAYTQIYGTKFTELAFSTVSARYFRITDAAGGDELMNQVLLLGMLPPRGLLISMR